MHRNLQEFAIGKSFITIAQDEGSLNQSAKYISLSCADFIQKQTTVIRRTGSKRDGRGYFLEVIWKSAGLGT